MPKTRTFVLLNEQEAKIAALTVNKYGGASKKGFYEARAVFPAFNMIVPVELLKGKVTSKKGFDCTVSFSTT